MANGAGAKAEPAEGQEVREEKLGAGSPCLGWKAGRGVWEDEQELEGGPKKGRTLLLGRRAQRSLGVKILALLFVALSNLTSLCLPSSLGIMIVHVACGCLEDQIN